MHIGRPIELDRRYATDDLSLSCRNRLELEPATKSNTDLAHYPLFLYTDF